MRCAHIFVPNVLVSDAVVSHRIAWQRHNGHELHWFEWVWVLGVGWWACNRLKSRPMYAAAFHRNQYRSSSSSGFSQIEFFTHNCRANNLERCRCALFQFSRWIMCCTTMHMRIASCPCTDFSPEYWLFRLNVTRLAIDSFHFVLFTSGCEWCIMKSVYCFLGEAQRLRHTQQRKSGSECWRTSFGIYGILIFRCHVCNCHAHIRGMQGTFRLWPDDECTAATFFTIFFGCAESSHRHRKWIDSFWMKFLWIYVSHGVHALFAERNSLP